LESKLIALIVNFTLHVYMCNIFYFVCRKELLKLFFKVYIEKMLCTYFRVIKIVLNSNSRFPLITKQVFANKINIIRLGTTKCGMKI